MATTKVSEVISQALVFIDDIRLTELLQVSPARFYRKMSADVHSAVPLLNRPPELFAYVSKDYVASIYDSASWVSTDDSVIGPVVFASGMTGYELASVTRRSEDGLYEEPYTDFTYDADTGDITFAQQEKAGVAYEIDFYLDGSFAELSITMMRLFALAVTTVWYDRFKNNWFDMQMKRHDSSFDTVNESTYIEKMTYRVKEVKQAFASELHKYEQDVNYNRAIPKVMRIKPTGLI